MDELKFKLGIDNTHQLKKRMEYWINRCLIINDHLKETYSLISTKEQFEKFTNMVILII